MQKEEKKEKKKRIPASPFVISVISACPQLSTQICYGLLNDTTCVGKKTEVFWYKLKVKGKPGISKNTPPQTKTVKSDQRMDNLFGQCSYRCRQEVKDITLCRKG